ncbi:MAG: response regulator [Proteobacteria bacterium]|nr:response regulator [Pseudomonadota bacterium]
MTEADNRYKSMFEDCHAVMLILNPETGDIENANRAACLFYGYSHEIITKMAISDINMMSREEVAIEMKKARNEERHYFLFKHRLADGNIRDVEVYSGPVTMQGKQLLYSIIHDVTIRMEAEENLKKAKADAERANAAKSEFLANMSHEIRTPLNAVTGFAELLTAMVTDETQRGYLDAIKAAGKSLLTLVNDILDLSKIEAGMMEIFLYPVDPMAIFNEIEQIFAMKVKEKGLRFELEIDKTIPSSLMLDETRLRQVLLNIAGNAVKFTDEGYVKVSVSKRGHNTAEGKLGLIISVEDTGIGIPEDQVGSIFQIFKQRPGQNIKLYGGTGLGLSISKKLVEMMHGEIQVTSRVNKGSVFKIFLRDISVAPFPAFVERRKTFDFEKIRFDGGNVLVVDDVESNRRVLREILSRSNLKVIEASNGQEGLLMLRERRPDMVIMDIRMPVMDGFQMVQCMKTEPDFQNIPVIALTASTQMDDKNKILFAGFKAFLPKPVNMSALFRELTHYLPYVKTGQTIHGRSDIADALANLKTDDNHRFGELLKELHKTVQPRIQSIKGAIKMKDINEFGHQIRSIGEKYAIAALSETGDDIILFADNFDIVRIKESVFQLSEILEREVHHNISISDRLKPPQNGFATKS